MFRIRAKQKEFRLKNWSVRWLWCCSYIIVMLIPMITVVVNYNINVKALKNRVIRTNELALQQVKENIDLLINAEKEFYSFVFLDENYQNLRNRHKEDAQFYYIVSLLHKNLNNYRNGIENMSCIVYLEKEDYIISIAGTSNVERFYSSKKHYFHNMPDYDGWREVLSGDYSNKYFVAQGFSHYTEEKCLIYAHTINLHEGKNNFFISIPISAIAGLSEYLPSNSWFSMELEEENIIFCNGSMTEAPADFHESDKYIRRVIDSDISDIAYHIAISENSLNKELEEIRRNFWLNLSITLIFGAIGIVLLTKFNYKPLHSLLKEVGETDSELGQGNEFQKLKDNYVYLQKEKVDSHILIEKQKKELQNAWLLMLLKGRTVKYQEQEELESLGISLTSSIGLVGFMVPLENNDFKYDELNFFVVNNIFSELMEGEKFYHIEDGGFVFYLFDIKLEMKEIWRKKALSSVEFVCKLLIEKFGISVIGTVSDVAEDLQLIKYQYKNVMSAFEYGRLIRSDGVIDVREMPDYNEFHMFEEYMNMEFREAFFSNDINRAFAVSDKLFTSFYGSSKVIVRVHVYETCIIMMDIFREYVNDAVQQEKAFRYLGSICREQTIEGIRKHFNELIQFITEEIARQKLSENKAIIIKIKKYVENNYADCNLNLNTMAENLQRHTRYLAKVFKDEKQMSILDYINNYRIMKAKELMKSNEYTLEEISKMVGYGNIRTFRRIFVKLTGELPSAYAEKSK